MLAGVFVYQLDAPGKGEESRGQEALALECVGNQERAFLSSMACQYATQASAFGCGDYTPHDIHNFLLLIRWQVGQHFGKEMHVWGVNYYSFYW